MREQCIKDMIDAKDYRRVIMSIVRDTQTANDLYQELALRFLELPESFYARFKTVEAFKWYYICVAKTYWCGKSRFKRLHRHSTAQAMRELCVSGGDIERMRTSLTGADSSMEEKAKQERFMQVAEQELDKLHWYNRDLLKLHLHMGSSAGVSRATGIPERSVSATVKSTLKHLKQKMEE